MNESSITLSELLKKNTEKVIAYDLPKTTNAVTLYKPTSPTTPTNLNKLSY